MNKSHPKRNLLKLKRKILKPKKEEEELKRKNLLIEFKKELMVKKDQEKEGLN
jgi:hypothetical protein